MLKPIQALMIQGTTSDAGKSVLVAGLCRVLHRKGVHVAPFKSQNMALNSAVTKDGGEIGRAQAVQAFAAGIEPTVHMNPVLLKPNSDIGAQVIVQGKALQSMDAIGFHGYKTVAMPYVMDSFAKLRSEFESIMIEGAGSPAEINLRENDIANMGFAEEANVPVIIVADIDRGGVFAHLYGTLALLSESEQNRVIGFVINRFRGDITLLEPGLDWLEEKTGKPVIGVLPYLHGLNIEAEDAITSEQVLSDRNSDSEKAKFTVRVPVLTRTSNHTDFDPLRLHPDIDFQYVGKGESLQGADLIILPGSKSVRSDLDYLRSQGWEKDIERHLRFGGKLMGICGGYQMLGKTINDPKGLESEAGCSAGLGYLNIETVLADQKQLQQVIGQLQFPNQVPVSVTGYEIHAGVTTVNGYQPLLIKNSNISQDNNAEVADGNLSECGQIFGSYLHGIFEHADAFKSILHWAGMNDFNTVYNHTDQKQHGINLIADAIEEHLDLKKLWPDLSW
ncbi:cobyric acid synthase [Vibrio rumoiensis]|uniref:Cobyric acid synthase n=1 Tax=Vibrio rumoiensis 1S-45 TaxID=1188252 RepID=A0A1E5DZ71_9VIBR|nr:cobyric acid synthase [Vibrio rumoiensis]OEF23208.1 cobyric acid synthase CobQ [Vibrio rumoiensis 1S-45]